MELVLCIRRASPTLLLDHAVSSDDVRERESTYVSAVTASVYGERKGEGEKRRKEREEGEKSYQRLGF